MDLHEIPKKFQYITVDSNFVNGTNNTFSLDLNLESNLHVEDMTKVLGIKMVDFYITQVGAQVGAGTPFTATDKIEGEIYISIPQVEKNAKEFGQSFSKELARIIIHGSLHLLNYDDKTTDEKNKMTEKENLYLEKCNCGGLF